MPLPPLQAPSRRGWIAATALLVLAASGDLRDARAAAPPDAALIARTDSLFAAWNRVDSPGCALGIIQDGRLVYARGYGMANLELGVAISPQTVFDIGSVSKQFTAFCVQLLARDGRLGLDDDIRTHIPEMPDYGPTIRIRHLLHHTSGIRDYNELLFMAGRRFEDVATKQMALDVIVRQKALNFAPGQQFLYSNSGYFLLSVIVERVSGQTMREFAEERIFRPLGMRHTLFNDSFSRIIPGRATGYEPNDHGFQIAMSQWEQTGDGAVLTSVEDLVLWDANFHDPRAGDAAVLAAMHATEPLADGRPNSYASGLDVAPWRGLDCVRHNGAWAGYRADLVRFPALRTSFICLTNLGSMNPTALDNAVAELWLADAIRSAAAVPSPTAATPPTPDPTAGLSAAPSVQLADAQLQRLVGRYRSAERGILDVTLVDGALQVAAPSIRRSTLRPLSDRRFERIGGIVPTLVEFELPATGHATGTTFRFQNSPPARFDAFTTWTPTPAEIGALLGRYRSSELDVVVEIARVDSSLVLRHPAAGDVPLAPLMRNHLEGLGGEITLQAKGGRTTGFEFNSTRMRGLLFSRITGP